MCINITLNENIKTFFFTREPSSVILVWPICFVEEPSRHKFVEQICCWRVSLNECFKYLKFKLMIIWKRDYIDGTLCLRNQVREVEILFWTNNWKVRLSCKINEIMQTMTWLSIYIYISKLDYCMTTPLLRMLLLYIGLTWHFFLRQTILRLKNRKYFN